MSFFLVWIKKIYPLCPFLVFLFFIQSCLSIDTFEIIVYVMDEYLLVSVVEGFECLVAEFLPGLHNI